MLDPYESLLVQIKITALEMWQTVEVIRRTAEASIQKPIKVYGGPTSLYPCSPHDSCLVARFPAFENSLEHIPPARDIVESLERYLNRATYFYFDKENGEVWLSLTSLDGGQRIQNTDSEIVEIVTYLSRRLAPKRRERLLLKVKRFLEMEKAAFTVRDGSDQIRVIVARYSDHDFPMDMVRHETIHAP